VKVELRMMVSMMRKLKKKEKVAYFKFANRFLKQFASPV
jgi:transcriptional regulator NrdR family protein